MGDSTSDMVFDSTSDTTAIIIIDSTSSDAVNFNATVAFGLVSDFDTVMGPLALKCKTLTSQMDGIKDQISGIGSGYTPGGVMNNAIANGVNAANHSSKWAQGADAINMAKNIMNKCPFFKEAADQFPKYGDPFKHIKSMASSASKQAIAALDKVLDDLKAATGYDMIEAQIGKQLAALTNTGRAVYDKVQKDVGDVAEAISPLIEYGKSAISQTKTALSAVTKELGKMDKLINCLTAVGGPDFADQVDAMNDTLNCYYTNLGIFDDPTLPNFGEFNLDQYLNTIGTLHPTAATNIKKSVNMYSKARNNAEGAIAKTSDIGKKSKSVIGPSAKSDPISKKKDYIAGKTKTTYTVPAIPGKTKVKTVEAPTPVPVGPPELPDPPVPAEPKVPITIWISESEVKFSNEEIETTYDYFDPNHAHFNEYLSDAISVLNTLEIVKPDQTPDLKMVVQLNSAVLEHEEKKDWEGTTLYLISFKSFATIGIVNKTTKKGVEGWEFNTTKSDQWADKSLVNDKAFRAPLFIKSFRGAIQNIVYTKSDIYKVL